MTKTLHIIYHVLMVGVYVATIATVMRFTIWIWSQPLPGWWTYTP